MNAFMSSALAWIDGKGSLRRLGLFRIVVGLMVLRHAIPFLVWQRAGRFHGDTWHVPYFAFLDPGEPAYIAILLVMVVSGAFVAAGLFTRPALWIATLATGTHFLLNQTWYSNNRVLLVFFLLLLALSPAGQALSLDAARKRPVLEGPTWTFAVIRAQASLMYLASATSKLLDPDWRSGAVLGGRAVIVFPDVAFFEHPAFRWPLGSGAIALELFLALGLWFGPTRRAAFWVGFLFHAMIEAMFTVLVFSPLMLGSYLLAVRGEERSRVLRYDPSVGRHRLLANVVRRLDWLAKVSVEPVNDAGRGAGLRARDDDGRWYRGWMAALVVLSAVPLAFPVVWPPSLLTHWGVGVLAGAEPLRTETPPAAPRPNAWATALLVAGAGLVVMVADVFSLDGTASKVAWAGALAFALTAASPAGTGTQDR